ncbi:hypothetical protein [Halogeometricum limi]|uniref:Uncharacterized protein n=1 Tax=Halogeometricum limi TaxID=555875 RepID=A0A1I6GQN2_9EURY|nr:hypothetical protein [Halogeometricum limi]SFR44504.1 hypothetical protein SAMN04488124_1406 [Halogeometricum limi]
MKIHYVVLAFALLLVAAFVGVGAAAAEEHPACEGTKGTISAEGAEEGSKFITKPVCSDSGTVEMDEDKPANDKLSVPTNRGTQVRCHDTARENSPKFTEANPQSGWCADV